MPRIIDLAAEGITFMEILKNPQFQVALALIGLVLMVIGVLADAIGLGGSPGFGIKQLILTLAGAAISGTGLYLRFSSK